MRLLFKKDEDGFTTVGTAVALLLVFALLFVALQAYWVGTRSGQVQYVADSAALAADGAVAEYVTYGQAVDAILLTFSLVTVVVYVVALVAAFIPGGQGVATKFLDVGQKVRKVRNTFAKAAEKGLNAAQKALPALCVARAAAVCDANSQASGISYVGAAIPFPLEGEEVSLSDEGQLDAALDELESHEEEIAKQAEEQEQAQTAADAAKKQGWLADCGSSGYNMRQRAATLAYLSGSQNPNYSSVDTWSWSAALSRAKTYYTARYNMEGGESAAGTPEDVAKSVARKRFYKYAREKLNECTITSTTSGERPSFVYLARNVAQIKQTELYTEAIYPVTSDGQTLTIHAYRSCPNSVSQTFVSYGSVSQIDSGTVSVCSECKFSATTLGRAPSPSTSISNGFEYYYRELVDAANAYAKAVDELEQANEKMREEEAQAKSKISEALQGVLGKRYDPQPPGRYGCVSVVYATSTPAAVTSSFIDGSVDVSARLAISGAALAADPDTSEANVISAIGANIIPSESAASGLIKTVFSAQGALLQAYCSGADGLESAFKSVLGAIPLVGTSMSSWAADEFGEVIKTCGLEPPDLKAYKPALVNTEHIFKADGGKVASAMLNLKENAQLVGGNSAQTIANILNSLDIPLLDDVEVTSEGIVLAKLDFSEMGCGTGTFSLVLPAPTGFIESCSEALESITQLGGG